MAEIAQVLTETDYEAALVRISELLGSEPYSLEDEELDRLSALVESYEAEHYPMGQPEPAAVLEFLLDQEMVTRQHMLALVGSDANLDAILAEQEPIPPGLAQLLYEKSGITTESMLKSPAGHMTKPDATVKAR